MGYGIRMIEATPEMMKSGEDYYCVQVFSMDFYRDLMRPILEWDSKVEIEPLSEEHIPGDMYYLSWLERLSHPSEEVREHFRKSREEISKRASDPTKILGMKFGLDPGGIVVSEECRLIVSHLDGLDCGVYEAEELEMINSWRAFCRLAIDYGGFDVS